MKRYHPWNCQQQQLMQLARITTCNQRFSSYSNNWTLFALHRMITLLRNSGRIECQPGKVLKNPIPQNFNIQLAGVALLSTVRNPGCNTLARYQTTLGSLVSTMRCLDKTNTHTLPGPVKDISAVKSVQTTPQRAISTFISSTDYSTSRICNNYGQGSLHAGWPSCHPTNSVKAVKKLKAPSCLV